MQGGFQLRLTERFIQDYKGLPIDLQRQVDACLIDLGRDPLPAARRAHSVTPRGQRPQVYTVDVTRNKSHKLSFHIEGTMAVLRRAGTHKLIDRAA